MFDEPAARELLLREARVDAAFAKASDHLRVSNSAAGIDDDDDANDDDDEGSGSGLSGAGSKGGRASAKAAAEAAMAAAAVEAKGGAAMNRAGRFGGVPGSGGEAAKIEREQRRREADAKQHYLLDFR